MPDEHPQKVVEYGVKSYDPEGVPEAELATCIAIIEAGEAVNPETAKRELPLARVLVIARSGGDIVGVGAIKQARPAYASGIAKKSKFAFDENTQELGYVAVCCKHRKRGLSKRIVAELLSRYDGGLFATTDHDGMKRTLGQAGFVTKGHEWEGERGQLSLWIREGSPPSKPA